MDAKTAIETCKHFAGLHDQQGQSYQFNEIAAMIESLEQKAKLGEAALMQAAIEITDAEMCDGERYDKCPADAFDCPREVDPKQCPLGKHGTIKDIYECWTMRWKSMASFDAVADELLRAGQGEG